MKTTTIPPINDIFIPHINQTMNKLYKDKSFEYYSSIRKEIFPLLPQKSPKVLELGCGSGNTLRWLKEINLCLETTGIEINKEVADQAKNIVDNVIVADIEHDNINLPSNHFDLVLCLDVFEHLRDPWTTSKLLVDWLKPDGILIASIPNMRYVDVLFNLLVNKDFKYQNTGIMDQSHLRFFTEKSSMSLIKEAGLNEIQIMLHPETIKGKSYFFNKLTLGYFRDVFSWQILVKGKKPHIQRS